MEETRKDQLCGSLILHSWSPHQKRYYYIGPNFGPKLYYYYFLWVFARNKGIPVLQGTLLEIRFVYET